jgi:hypothetical protein
VPILSSASGVLHTERQEGRNDDRRDSAHASPWPVPLTAQRQDESNNTDDSEPECQDSRLRILQSSNHNREKRKPQNQEF